MTRIVAPKRCLRNSNRLPVGKQWPSTKPNCARCGKRLSGCGRSGWPATLRTTGRRAAERARRNCSPTRPNPCLPPAKLSPLEPEIPADAPIRSQSAPKCSSSEYWEPGVKNCFRTTKRASAHGAITSSAIASSIGGISRPRRRGDLQVARSDHSCALSARSDSLMPQRTTDGERRTF